jgi:hypothetical protein
MAICAENNDHNIVFSSKMPFFAENSYHNIGFQGKYKYFAENIYHNIGPSSPYLSSQICLSFFLSFSQTLSDGMLHDSGFDISPKMPVAASSVPPR